MCEVLDLFICENDLSDVATGSSIKSSNVVMMVWQVALI